MKNLYQEENIIHIDMDAFFASIEQNDNPSLKGKPIAVCNRKDSRGVISTASYEARKFNIHSGMSVKRALSIYPDLILIEARFERYIEVSNKIYEILYQYTPIIERSSIDEAFLDVKGCHLLFGPTIEIAKKIKNEIKEKLNLTCSVGISINKLVAKIASDYKKPDGFTFVPKNEILNFLAPLKIEKIPSIGEKTSSILNKMGVYYIKDLREIDLKKLVEIFGIYGEKIYFMARGIDDSPVVPENEQEEKSISNEITLEFDTTDIEIIKNYILKLSDKVAERLRSKNLKGKTIKLKIKFFDFKQLTRQITLKSFTNQGNIIYKTALSLLETISIRPIRLIGVGVSNFNIKKNQLLLFSEKNEENIESVKDKLPDNLLKRAKFLDNNRE
jgi:DNA polymerase-4